jgi:SPW repeat-containing protein
MELKNVPWTLLLSAVLGIWLLSAPAVLGVGNPAAASDHLLGALVVTWSVIAFGEVTRPVRFLNLVMGAWLAVAPWPLSGETTVSRWNDVFVGVLLIALSFRRGTITERFSGWNRYLV